MREIIFRAWDVKGKKMYEVSSLWGGGKHWELEPQRYGAKITSRIGDYEWYPCVLMQFTGLKDRDGKEIYEGDIIESDDDDGKECFDVYFLDGSFVVHTGEEIEVLFNIDTSLFEVIGNIYENPNLIKTT